MKRVVIAGGGTAGHVEPGIAVARWLSNHFGESCSIEFIGTSTGVEVDLVPRAGFRLHKITKAVLPRRLSLQAAAFPVAYLRSIAQAAKVIRGADVLIGFGGYVSGSAYIAARMTGVPIVAHEANAKAGFANRLAAALGGTVAITFESARSTSRRWKSAINTGLPIKHELVELAAMSSTEREVARTKAARQFGCDGSRPILLVFGGSLGARQINHAVAEYLQNGESNIDIIHAVGNRSELPASTEHYKPVAYIYEMASAYAAADLIISRSGAVTCVEVAAVNRRAIFVPLAIGNGEQAHNAAELVDRGVARIVENQSFTGQWLMDNLRAEVSAAVAWRDSAAAHSVVDAARLIGELAIERARNNGR